MKKNVIEMHATWLAINSIIGCTNGCKYCFLQTESKNVTEPHIITSPKESVEQLMNCKYYNSNIPICLLPNTDAFLNKNNTNYLKELLLEIRENNISNQLITITKCKIDQTFIDFLKKLDIDKQIIFYLSYSGLEKDIEPNINPNNIRENFILLYNNKIKTIHYFRPMIPQNSDSNKIKSILEFVNKYTEYSVITGLKLKEEYFDKIYFWEEIKDYKEDCIKAEGVWPSEAFDYFYNKHEFNQKIFQTNACALASLKNIPSPAYYNTYECKNYNLCSADQRERCKQFHSLKDLNKIKQQIIYELIKINKYNNNINTIFLDNKLIIENVDLEVSDLSYLTYMCGIKITTNGRSTNEKYFNSSLNGSKPLVLRRKNE